MRGGLCRQRPILPVVARRHQARDRVVFLEASRLNPLGRLPNCLLRTPTPPSSVGARRPFILHRSTSSSSASSSYGSTRTRSDPTSSPRGRAPSGTTTTTTTTSTTTSTTKTKSSVEGIRLEETRQHQQHHQRGAFGVGTGASTRAGCRSVPSPPSTLLCGAPSLLIPMNYDICV